jgi:hypothetical protein
MRWAITLATCSAARCPEPRWIRLRYEALSDWKIYRYLFSATAAAPGNPQVIMVYESVNYTYDGFEGARRKPELAAQLEKVDGFDMTRMESPHKRLVPYDRPGVIISLGLSTWLAILHDTPEAAAAYARTLKPRMFFNFAELTYKERGDEIPRAASREPILLLPDGTPAPVRSASAASAPSAQAPAAAQASAPTKPAKPDVVVCAPDGKRVEHIRDVKWGKWSGQDKLGCCEPEHFSSVDYGELDGDGKEEALVQYDEFGEMGGFHMSWQYVVTLRDGCLAYLGWPEPLVPESRYSEGGVAKTTFTDGELIKTYHFSDYPQSWFKTPLEVVARHYKIVDGKLVELLDKRTASLTGEAKKREDEIAAENAPIVPPTEHVLPYSEIAATEIKRPRYARDAAERHGWRPGELFAKKASMLAAVKRYEKGFTAKMAASGLPPSELQSDDGRQILLFFARPDAMSNRLSYFFAFDLKANQVAFIKEHGETYYQLMGADDPVLQTAVKNFAREHFKNNPRRPQL